ncbi:hypothetical protein GGR52DRAFT_558277 [Hypoxylon sp. FL1284]|nr:hypothetical protein GGR52DRAFT_558277 [Hypoxylon sp. FL1284]
MAFREYKTLLPPGRRVFSRFSRPALCRLLHVSDNMRATSILLAFVVGSWGLEVSSGEVVSFELRIGTVTGLGSVEFEPDHCFPTAGTTAQTTVNEDPASTTDDVLGTGTPTSTPVLESTETLTQTLTQTISKTIIQTVLVTVAPPSSPTLPGTLMTASPGTAPWNGTRNGTGSFTFGLPPTPTFDTITGISGCGKLSTRQAWYSLVMVIGFLYLL